MGRFVAREAPVVDALVADAVAKIGAEVEEEVRDAGRRSGADGRSLYQTARWIVRRRTLGDLRTLGQGPVVRILAGLTGVVEAGEIAGDVAITFDPESIGEIAAALERLLAEPEQERADRVARGLDWVKHYSWADHAAGLVKLLEGAA